MDRVIDFAVSELLEKSDCKCLGDHLNALNVHHAKPLLLFLSQPRQSYAYDINIKL